MGRCGFGPERSARRLVRSGIALLVLGHLNLVLGAVVHGAVLRHVARPDRHAAAAAAEYAAANIIAVGSGFLSIVAGVVALLVSRPLFHPALDTALALWLPSMAMAAAEAGLSVWCCLASLALCGLRPCTASSKAAKLRGPEEATPERGCGGEPHPQRHPLLGMEAGRH